MVRAISGRSALFRTDDVAQLRVGGSEGRRDVEVEESLSEKLPVPGVPDKAEVRARFQGGHLLGPRLRPGTDAVVAVQRKRAGSQSLLG